MNIKKNIWKSTISSRGVDASVFNNPTTPSTLYEDHPYSRETFIKNFDLLNKRINSIHKELTYWNLYRISTSVNSSEDLAGIVSALVPGEACIINTNTFSNQDVTYSRGDVIVKLITDELIKIDSVNSGLYFPSQISYNEITQTYNIIYRYSASMPLDSSTYTQNSFNDAPAAEPAMIMSFNNLAPTVASTIYGINEVLLANQTSFTFHAEHLPPESGQSIGQLIYPVIKFFFQGEDISCDFSISYSSTNDEWTVNFNTPATLYPNDVIIQVK